MTIVVPAIIPKDRKGLESEINLVGGFADLVQIDISDGIFTPFKTWTFNGLDERYFEELQKEEIGLPMWEVLNFEVHLMTLFPEEIVRKWIYAGVSGVVAHIESTENFQKVIDICRENLVSIGVAIKPSTDIKKIDKIIHQVDFVQIMGSDTLGKHGTEADFEVYERIHKLRKDFPESIIAIDIGVNENSAEEFVKCGANKLIVGSAILNDPNPEEAYKYFASL